MDEGAGEMLAGNAARTKWTGTLVGYATVGGTAKAGEDFEPASGLLTLAKDKPTRFVKFPCWMIT